MEQNDSDELIAACIWSLCTNEEIQNFAQENFEKLNSIQQHSNSSLICHVISDKVKCLDRTTNWIIKYQSILLSKFIIIETTLLCC
jgi:hypothetical protein